MGEGKRSGKHRGIWERVGSERIKGRERGKEGKGRQLGRKKKRRDRKKGGERGQGDCKDGEWQGKGRRNEK